MIEAKWFALVIGYCLLREIYFLYAVHSLLNKLMSRNYHEFQITESRGKMKPQEPVRRADDDMMEDFGILSGIN